jgi:hypothetical protein
VTAAAADGAVALLAADGTAPWRRCLRVVDALLVGDAVAHEHRLAALVAGHFGNRGSSMVAVSMLASSTSFALGLDSRHSHPTSKVMSG